MQYRVLWVFVPLIFSSCYNKTYQISTLRSKEVGLDYVFQNEDIALTYDFWKKGGKLHFSIYNLTDGPIYIDWKHSNFVFNGYSLDYYSGVELTVEASVYGDYGVVSSDRQEYAAIGASSSVSLSIEEKQVKQIPPQAMINSEPIALRFPEFFIKKGEVLNFEKSNSPLDVRVYLAYSKNHDLKKLEFVDNEFWVSKSVEVKPDLLDEVESPGKFHRESNEFSLKKTLILLGSVVTVLLTLILGGAL